ncbi:hypothetical protein GWC77_22040 [Paraburkholderia sp. NMBU_R16]|nr:hypothetical protein [Paraburkholderia sp. NMBU_R16]
MMAHHAGMMPCHRIVAMIGYLGIEPSMQSGMPRVNQDENSASIRMRMQTQQRR